MSRSLSRKSAPAASLSNTSFRSAYVPPLRYKPTVLPWRGTRLMLPVSRRDLDRPARQAGVCDLVVQAGGCLVLHRRVAQ